METRPDDEGEPITVRQTESRRIYELVDGARGDKRVDEGARLDIWVRKAAQWVACEFHRADFTWPEDRGPGAGPWIHVELGALGGVGDLGDLSGYLAEVEPGGGVWRKRLDVADRFRWPDIPTADEVIGAAFEALEAGRRRELLRKGTFDPADPPPGVVVPRHVRNCLRRDDPAAARLDAAEKVIDARHPTTYVDEDELDDLDRTGDPGSVLGERSDSVESERGGPRP